jgi:multidrug efflux pump subunit AcrA (membrane-fusion protein)
VPALGANKLEGTMTNVVRTVDAKTHTAEAICVPKELDARLSADMTAKVEAVVSSEDAVTVPRSAVLLRRDDRVVFVKSGDHVLQRRVVRLGPTIGDEIEVLEGLKVGDAVVVKNAVLLDGELDQVL